MDALPAPAWDYFLKLPYDYSVIWFDEKPVFNMNTSRGCPFQCGFCSVGSIWGKKYTYMSARRIFEDIEYVHKRYKVRGIYFREDNFTLNKQRVIDLCELLLKNGLNIKWMCETRVDTLNEEMLRLMHRAGCRALYFGIESGSQRILDFVKKGITIKQAEETIRLCNRIGIATAASFIYGIPTETEEEREETKKFIKKLRADVTWQNVFVGIPDSKLYRYILDNNLYEFKDKKGFIYPAGSSSLAKTVYGKGFEYSESDRNLDEAVVKPIRTAQIARPDVSIIMSVYNGSRFLPESVNSILRQNFRNWELIIIDDGSTDETLTSLEQFHDERIMIISQDHRGLTCALNTALKYARGRYIARMDADDISTDYRIEKQFRFLEKNTDYGLIGSSFVVIDDNDKETGTFYTFNNDAYIRTMLTVDNQFCHGSVMFRKEVLERVGLFDIAYKYSQDYEMWWRIACKFKIANIPDVLYKWRKSESGISTKKSNEQMLYAQSIKDRIKNEYLLQQEWKSLLGKGEENDTMHGQEIFNLRKRIRLSEGCCILAEFFLKHRKYELSEKHLKRALNAFFINPRAVTLLLFLYANKQFGLFQWILKIRRLLAL